MNYKGEGYSAVKKKIICFGIGKIYEDFLKMYDDAKAVIVALSDNDSDKWTLRDVIEPSRLMETEFDYIVITSSYFDEIKRQLCGYGIDENSILCFYDIYKNLAIKNNYAMLNILKDNVPLAVRYDKEISNLKKYGEKNLFLNAKIFVNAMSDKKLRSLKEVEFQVFSQFGEDGIIQWLIHNVDISNKTFIEFGVEDYTESNTRFLLMNNNWSGFVMDGSEDNISRLTSQGWFWKYDLTAIAAFITRDNINQLIVDAGLKGNIGILSIDLDGNDWWILNAITCVSPSILICEYNNIFGAEKKVTVPYDAGFVRTRKHYSNLYWGCSIAAYCSWAEENGYYYMGSNSAGNNAFFVKKDCIGRDRIPENANAFIDSKYRESRDRKGNLTYLKGNDRLKCIASMELLEIETGCIDTIENINHL